MSDIDMFEYSIDSTNLSCWTDLKIVTTRMTVFIVCTKVMW